MTKMIRNLKNAFPLLMGKEQITITINMNDISRLGNSLVSQLKKRGVSVSKGTALGIIQAIMSEMKEGKDEA